MKGLVLTHMGKREEGLELVGDGGEQRLLVGEVVVERARSDPELGAEAAHGEVREPVAVQDGERLLDHVAAVVAHLTPFLLRPR